MYGYMAAPDQSLKVASHVIDGRTVKRSPGFAQTSLEGVISSQTYVHRLVRPNFFVSTLKVGSGIRHRITHKHDLIGR